MAVLVGGVLSDLALATPTGRRREPRLGALLCIAGRLFKELYILLHMALLLEAKS